MTEMFNAEGISDRAGLRFPVVEELLLRGWKFVDLEDSMMWVSPQAQKPLFIPHDEPECDGKCGNMSVHNHGLPCFKKCEECNGLCHPDCPAYRKVEDNGEEG
jgi:hypothetical protein